MVSKQEFDFFIQWHLTERCNLRCKHCYQTGERSEELSFRQVTEVLGQVREMLDTWEDLYQVAFSRSFNVTGGEPFLRDDLLPILSEMDNKGFDLFLLTNGVLVDADRAKRLAEHHLKGVQVSIEGPESVHDAIRGKGSFAASVIGVGHLLDAGLNVTLNVTLSTVNAGDFAGMISLASSLGVQRLGFSRLVPAGRGLELLDMMLPTDKVKSLYEEIFAPSSNLSPLSSCGLDLVTGDPVAAQMGEDGVQDETPSVAKGGCAAGVSGLTFLPDGTIMPCRRLPIPIGNVLTDSLREVWATSKVLDGLRTRKRYKGKCRTCTRWAFCRGCRAIAYAYSQAHGVPDYLAADPQCFIDASASLRI